MTFAVVASTYKASADGLNLTTTGIDTTGANLIVIAMCDNPTYPKGAPTDNKGNTFTQRVLTTSYIGIGIWECLNPTVGSGHTFTANFANHFDHCMGVLAVSGAHASAAFDTKSEATSNAVTSLASGSITPSEDNELLVAVGSFYVAGTSSLYTISSPFTGVNYLNKATNNYGFVFGYEIQTTATARNPTVGTMTSSTLINAAVACWKAAAAAGGIAHVLTGPLRGPLAGPLG